jgi:hypothetical protein
MTSTKTETPTWERFKENAAPLERGRNVEVLERSLAVETDEERQYKEATTRHYEKLVEPSERMAVNNEELVGDDDPLIHWLSYIKFHQDAYPSDKNSLFLLLERCTRALLSHKKYANDVRFIRVCVMYADQTSDPGEIFKYLHSQKVGSLTALFWIAWAFWAEKQENFPFAEKIFKKGLSKKAKPLNLLEQRHRQFERRMARHWMNAAQRRAEGFDDDEDEINNRGSRGVLGKLSEDAFRRNDRSSARNNHHNVRSHNSSAARAFPSSSMSSTFIDRSSGGRRQAFPPTHSTTNAGRFKPSASGASGFHIYVEEGQENEGYNLDRAMPVNEKRRLATEEDRRKENTLAAERWNQRGSLYATTHYAHAATSTAAAPVNKSETFPVFVDEECAARHQREELQQKAEEDRRRRHRDERTFRPLEAGDSVTEKLYQDPLRYVKDPSQVKEDQELAKRSLDAKAESSEDDLVYSSAVRPAVNYSHLSSRLLSKDSSSNHQSKQKGSSSARVHCAFDKSLLAKDCQGQECCFEEQRASRGHYKLVPSTTNFNDLQQPMADDSEMDIDESRTTNGDVTMEDATANAAAASHQKQGSRRVLFRNDTSFEIRDRSINVSQCSSTVNESQAVGIPNQEEETINTKLAMKELSMMFSSPGIALTSSKKPKRAKTDQELIPGLGEHNSFESHQGGNQDDDGSVDSGGDTANFETIMDLVGNVAIDPNNSVLRVDDAKADSENQGTRNPLSRAGSPQEMIDKAALRTLKSDDQASSRSCRAGGPRRAFGPIAQDDPFASAKVNPLHDDPGFAIFEDPEDNDGTQSKTEGPGLRSHEDPKPAAKETASGFSVHEDRKPAAKESAPVFSICEDSKPSAKRSSSGLSVFEDCKPPAKESKSGLSVFEDSKLPAKESTSKFSIFEDSQPPAKESASKFSIFKDSQPPATELTSKFSIHEDRKSPQKPSASGFSIYNDKKPESAFKIYEEEEPTSIPSKTPSTKASSFTVPKTTKNLPGSRPHTRRTDPHKTMAVIRPPCRCLAMLWLG